KSNTFSPFDLSIFFKSLSYRVQNINIEGAALVGEKIFILNRGVQATPSQMITVNSKTLSIISIASIDFGLLKGLPLHGSEICFYDNDLYALAVAEDADNSYDDGEIIGSTLVQISVDDFHIKKQWMFENTIKAEGLCRYTIDNNERWLITTDPDGVGHSDFFTLEIKS
ncbi:MAG: hypothetical protein K2Q18_13795, partial [Bdellovibrionales bacterium]|nr:hypothetical protein [Bdellovibrionales bacterium]